MSNRVWVTGPVAEAALGPLREIAEVEVRPAPEKAAPEEMLREAVVIKACCRSFRAASLVVARLKLTDAAIR